MEDKIKNSFIYSFLCKDKYLKDLIILNLKSLIDNKNERKITIDYNRLRDELIFYKYYGVKYNNSSYNINFILPIILSNTNLNKSENEIIKNIFYYCKVNKEDVKKYEYILVGIAYNYLVHKLIKNSNIEFEYLLENIKNHIIEFSFEERMEKKDIIRFERLRISFIQKIDRISDENLEEVNEESIIDGFLRVIYQVYIKDYEEQSEELKSIKNSILGILDFKIDNIDIENIDFIKSLSNYLLKLRKYEINKKLYNESTHPKELINLNVGDVVYNPILNNIKVIDKKIEGDILYIKVQSKSGDYIFRFKRA
ncbi:hypothetical protein [Tepidibacter formicigenes]|jgi:hypothetical protein|uniref:Uncharacterized protein n=1 Tax=Tepidibacter formicigenes DSM 15518 TaxID=1123349 RepID=A0A1M6KRW5_9FIRM|nr:hypothetical protein [Tepidibacter formicigenes]SHJ61705.1 hypothetical protein SAMN02744037_00456 [Tepidibacter formicigenes DSM 15518]